MSFKRKVLTILIGTVLGRFFTIAITPFLTRLYTPEQFGLFGTFLSIISITSFLTKLGYDRAIVIVKRATTAKILLTFLLGFVIVSSFFVALTISYFWSDLNFPLIFLGLVFFAYNSMLDYLYTRFAFYNLLSTLRVIKNIGVTLLQLFLYFVSPHIGLVIGFILGNFISFFIGFFLFLRKEKIVFTNISVHRIKKILVSLSDFPKYGVWGSLLNSISINISVLLLALYFSNNVVGQFFLTYKVLQLPTSFMGQAISLPFLEEFSRHISSREFHKAKQLFWTLEKKLALYSFLPFSILTVFSEELFTIFFGEKWYIAGKYAQFMSVWLYFNFITSPISTVYTPIRRQDIFLISQIFFVFIRIFAIIIGGFFLKNAFLTIILLSLGSAILYLSFLLYTHSIIFKLSLKNFLYIIVYPYLTSVCFLVLIKINLV